MNKRIKELDLLKTFVLVIAMVGIHTCYDLTTLDVADHALTRFINILSGTFGAPIFMFCMGVTLGFSRHAEPKDWFYRGVSLLTIGMALNVFRWGTFAIDAYLTNQPELYKGLALIYNVDIMQFAGLAFMLFALLKHLRLNHWHILLLAIGLNIAGSLMEGHHTSSYVVNQIAGYFYPTPTCCCFPLLNWFIFVAAGNLMGEWYRTQSDMLPFFRVAMPIGGIVTAVYLYLTIVVQVPCLRTLQGDWGFYWMNPYDALPTAFFVAPFSLGVFWLIARWIPDSWMTVLAFPSKHINQFFCVSWLWIMWIAHVFLFVPKATTIASFVLMWVVIIVLTVLTIILYNRYMEAHISPWFSRHAVSWTVGIWLFLLAFGAWYFTHIPEPYIMPY